MAAVGLQDGFTAAELRRLAQSRRDAGQVRRFLALAVIYNGGSRSEAARIGGVACRRCGIGCCGLAATDPLARSTAKPPGVARASMRPSGPRWRRPSRVARLNRPGFAGGCGL